MFIGLPGCKTSWRNRMNRHCCLFFIFFCSFTLFDYLFLEQWLSFKWLSFSGQSQLLLKKYRHTHTYKYTLRDYLTVGQELRKGLCNRSTVWSRPIKFSMKSSLLMLFVGGQSLGGLRMNIKLRLIFYEELYSRTSISHSFFPLIFFFTTPIESIEF